ncbi:PREDICTED: receptor-type tyrosine-protein phosphatase alpha-like, partial [Mandrillus leucophaeus]|uniref:receptor-type tyrosine-protein phosphatase alpha-like n=1 Tax=Mandrillus leucophaeus TaxID=9568 RepID=UPI0005F46A9B
MVPFKAALTEHLALMQPSREQVQRLIAEHLPHLTPSIRLEEPLLQISVDSWFIRVLLGSDLIRVSAHNATTVAPSVGITRRINSSMAEPVKEEAKTSNPTSSLTSLSVSPTFSRNITLGPVNSSDSDNGTTRTASTNSIGTTISANGTWLPDNQFADARTEPWEGNSSTAATTPETFPPS